MSTLALLDRTAFCHPSTDAGVTWQDISGAAPYTRLPDLGFHSIAQHRFQPDTLYVATDSGVYKTTDRGDWWYPYDEGLPNAVLTAMDYSPNWNSLYASTIGRGLWTRTV